MKLGVNTVLFRHFDFATAVETAAFAGYAGIEIAAIRGMCEHLALDRWQEQVAAHRRRVADAGLEWLAMEVGAPDPARVSAAFAAAEALGIPVVTIGPGGTSDDPDEWPRLLDRLGGLATQAERAGINLAVKAHIGQSMYNTATTIAVLDAIRSPRLGVDLDPSHLFRSGEDPSQAAAAVRERIHHVHIRDCKRGSAGPGTIRDQVPGRGDINLLRFCRTLADGGYPGVLDLEVIGAQSEPLTEVAMVAAESRGYLHAALRATGGDSECGGRPT